MIADLYLLIRKEGKPPTAYRVEWLHEGAWKLTKGCGTIYHVSVDGGVPSCECEDYRHRRHICKHIRGLQELHLLSLEQHGSHQEETQEALSREQRHQEVP